MFPSFALFLVVERYVLARLLEDVSRLGNVLVLGTGPDTERVVEEIRRRSPGNLRLAGVPPARREEIAFWLLMLLTTWGNSSFGVLMEGPVLGIWFWFALGFASGRSVAYPGRPAVASRPRQPSGLPRPGRADNLPS